MQEKITNIIKQFPKNKKIFLVLILVGVILIICSTSFSSTTQKKSEESTTSNYTEYNEQLENKLMDTISSIDGVGECKVMITLNGTNKSVYAVNSESKKDTDSESSSQEYVIYDASDGEQPMLINQDFPSVKGVAVVCNGGDDIVVKEKVIETVSSLFNISTNRISVSKLNNNR